MQQSTFSTISQLDQNSIFKILVATDNHLGFKENDIKRGQDSFDAFREILQNAKSHKVDFVLLGGDLFHDINPSADCLYETINIMQQNVLGPGDINFEIFDYQPNFSELNLNIDLPIFIIHGNHDAPTNSLNNISVLDLLHAGKYINYYGKHTNNEYVKVYPIRFVKGETKIALYGIGYMKDSRLYKLFEQKKIEFVRPQDPENYLNILVVHQNRFKGERFGAQYKNCIHPQQFPDWFNLIIWGHEHECKGHIEEYAQYNFQIYQPGSSVAVKLIEEEAKPKACGMLRIFKSQYDFEPIYLKESFRAMLYQQIELTEYLKKKEGTENINFVFDNEAAKIIEETLESLIQKWEEQNVYLAPEQRRLPLVRIKIEYSGLDILRTKQIENKFKDKVANEGEILSFWRRRQEVTRQQNITNISEEKFMDTLQQKKPLNIQSNDEHKDLIRMFAKKMDKQNVVVCPLEIMLECIDFEKTNSSKLQRQLNINKNTCIKNIMTEEQYKLKQQNSLVQKKLDQLSARIQNNLANKSEEQQQQQDENLDFNFKYEISEHIDQFQKHLINKIGQSIKNQIVEADQMEIDEKQQNLDKKTLSCKRQFELMQNKEEEEKENINNQEKSKSTSGKESNQMENINNEQQLNIQNFITTTNLQTGILDNVKCSTFFVKKINTPQSKKKLENDSAYKELINKKLNFEEQNDNSLKSNEIDEEFINYFSAENEASSSTNLKGKKKKVEFDLGNQHNQEQFSSAIKIPSLKQFQQQQLIPQVQQPSPSKKRVPNKNQQSSNKVKNQKSIPQMLKPSKENKKKN